MNAKTLDLETLTLQHGEHGDPSEGMCVMEAVAFVAGEPFTDHPRCACPVISEFLREYNDILGDSDRQALKAYIPRLVGSKADAATESRRGVLLIDWILHIYLPAWLRKGGLAAWADRLTLSPEMTPLAVFDETAALLKAAAKDAYAARTAAWTAARTAARTVRTAAWTAAWNAAETAAETAAWLAAWNAAETAAETAAGTAAWNAAWNALAPTVLEIRATIPTLIERLLAAKAGVQ